MEDLEKLKREGEEEEGKRERGEERRGRREGAWWNFFGKFVVILYDLCMLVYMCVCW